MNKNKAIENTVAVDDYLCSVDGNRIYDLMKEVYVDNGHGQKLQRWGASGAVFYTTDTNLIEELKKVKSSGDLKDIKEFLSANKDSIHELHELYKNGLQVMSDKEFMAFKHLSDSSHRKDTLKNGFYGSAHLVEDEKILFFYQNHISIRDHFNGKDLNKQKNYFEAQEALLKAYKSGKIEPDGQFIGGARDKVLNSLLDINFTNLSNYQKETVLMLQEFSNSVLTDAKFHTKLEKTTHVASFSKGQKKIEIELPRDKGNEFVVQNNGNTTNIKKVADLLSYVNSEIAQENVNSFLKRRKI